MPSTKTLSDPTVQNMLRICKEIKSLRKAKRLTLRQLGARCGRTAGHLSQIENGSVTPSIDSISRIAEALGVEASWFLPNSAGAGDSESSVIVRNQGRRRISYSFDTKELGYQDFLLSADLTLDLVMGLTRLEPGGKTRGIPTQSHGHMCGYVSKGWINLTAGKDEYLLGPEDSFSFDLAVEHDFINAHDDITEMIWAISPTHLDF